MINVDELKVNEVYDYEKESKKLKEYAKENDIYKLTGEDILKILGEGHCINNFIEAFNITEKEFKDIRKKKNITNIYLEKIIRDIDAIIYYIDNKGMYVSNKVIKKIADVLSYSFSDIYPNKKFYRKKLSEINFCREYVYNDISEKSIDLDYRLKNISPVIKNIDKMLEAFLSQEKDFLLKYNNKLFYNKLMEEKNNGKIFSKEELTYDLMFELAVIENNSDWMIGQIFNMEKDEIRNLRRKMGIQNKYKSKIEKYPEAILYYMEEKGLRDKNITNLEYYKFINVFIESYNEKELFKQEENNDDMLITIDGITYNINVSENPYSVKSGRKRKSSKGSRHNQKKENEIKIDHGKHGEKIIKEYEKKRLIKLGLNHLVNEVKLITQIDEETTFDGVGYDIISFNEEGERICIEVKTSYGKRDKPFFISKKELEILNGYSEEFDCKHSFIYYVLIDDSYVDIKIIDCDNLGSIRLEPVLYKVVETIE